MLKYKASAVALISIFFHIFSVQFSVAGVLAIPDCFSTTSPEQCIADGSIEQIYIFDEIEDRDLKKISLIATQLPHHRKFPIVVLNSDGGDLNAAIGIGRILRWRHATAITRDLFKPESMPMCFSACVLVGAGAVERNLDVIGIHSGYSERRIKKDIYEKNILPEKTNERIRAYYLEMGINLEILEIMNRTPFDKMEYFYFRLDEPLDKQIIHQLGFRMRGSNAEDVKRIGLWLDTKKWSNGSLNQVAKLGDAEAQYKLGKTALLGLDGWPKNLDAAILWLNKAADQNHIGALHLLGVAYSNGYEGIEVDKSKAFSYYLKAAKLGYGGSQNNLAWAYYKGDGVEKNLYEAIYWVTKATERGDYFSYGSLGAMRFQEKVFIDDDIETYKWLKLGTDFMPSGNARDADLSLLAEIKKRMTSEQIQVGDELVKNWKPLIQSQNQMRDKND